MTIAAEEELLTQREQILLEISDINLRARHLVIELRVLDRKLLMLSRDDDATEYAGFRLAIQAITEYLKKRGRAAPKETIAKALVRGGWNSSDERAYYNVIDSILYHTKRQGMKKEIIREVDGMIGLFEWSDELFKQDTKSDRSAE